MSKSTTFSAPFERSLLPPGTKILSPIISFIVKTKDIDNQYDLYSITCAYGSSMLEGVNLSVSYAPLASIKQPQIIIAIVSAEGLIILSWKYTTPSKILFTLS